MLGGVERCMWLGCYKLTFISSERCFSSGCAHFMFRSQSSYGSLSSKPFSLQIRRSKQAC